MPENLLVHNITLLTSVKNTIKTKYSLIINSHRPQ